MSIERITPDNQAEWRGLGLQHLQRYELASRFTAGKSVLDLACGNGYGAYTLSNLGSMFVTAADLDPGAIQYAQSHYARPGLKYLQANCFDLQRVEPGYEAIVSFETIEHLEQPKQFVKKLRELISDRGRLVVSAPNTLCHKRAPEPVINPYHPSEPTYEEFKEWIETKFLIDQEWEQSPIAVDSSWQGAMVEKSGLIRWILNLERFLKTVLGRSSLSASMKYAASQARRTQQLTQVFPLLPERRPFAGVFIFVCSPRPA